MKKFSPIQIVTGALVASILIAAIAYVALPKTPPPPPDAPEVQAARLTSYVLKRKIGELRSTAIYLQHKEEGAALILKAFAEEQTD